MSADDSTTKTQNPNPTASGVTNTTPGSVVKSKLDIIVLKHVIFKRASPSVYSGAMQEAGVEPLTREEKEKPPPWTDGIGERLEWELRYQIMDDYYGHWWVEVYNSETDYNTKNLVNSWGWWPKYGVGFKETVTGAEGQLNGKRQIDPIFPRYFFRVILRPT